MRRERAGALPSLAKRGEGGRVVLVANATRGIGGSSVAALLALACAREDRDTLLVVGDGPLDGGPQPGSTVHRLGVASLHDAAPLCGDYDLVIVDAGSRFDAAIAASALGIWRLVAVSGADAVESASAYALVKAISTRWPEVVVELLVNQHEPDRGMNAFYTVNAASERFLARRIRYAGTIPEDDELRAAAGDGTPMSDLVGRTRAGLAAQLVAARLLAELDEDARRSVAHRPLHLRH
ncbi:MAG: MinD/ParA family protein [Gemmatimonadales bacterium]